MDFMERHLQIPRLHVGSHCAGSLQLQSADTEQGRTSEGWN